MCICKECGRTIETRFFYCPWCGHSRVDRVEEEDTFDLLFEKFEKVQLETQTRRLMDMGNRLDVLEKELSTLVLSAEMHK